MKKDLTWLGFEPQTYRINCTAQVIRLIISNFGIDEKFKISTMTPGCA